MQNALALLKLMAQSEEDIKNNRFESQEIFLKKWSKNLHNNLIPPQSPLNNPAL
jgi:hypothetical protein